MSNFVEKYQLIILSLILSIGLIVSVLVGTSVFSRDCITVTGSAFEIVKSDSGKINLEIVTRDIDKSKAFNKIKTQLPEVEKYLKDKGIKDIEIQAFNGYNTYKMTPNGISTNEIAYFNLSQPIIVKSNDVDKIKEISSNIQSLVDKGIEINIISTDYYYSKLSDMKVKLLKEASKDAKERANAMLKPTHTHLGKVKSIQMGVFQITPADSTNVSDMGYCDTSTIDKKITAVANVVFKI